MTEYPGVFILLGGALLVVGSVVLMDWLARRRDRQSRDRAA